MALRRFRLILQQWLTVLPANDQILHHMDMDRLLLPLGTITNNAGHYFQKLLFTTLNIEALVPHLHIFHD